MCSCAERIYREFPPTAVGVRTEFRLSQMVTAAEMGLPLSGTSNEEPLPSATFFLRMAEEMYQNAHDLLTQLKAFIELRAGTKVTVAAPPTFVSAFPFTQCRVLTDSSRRPLPRSFAVIYLTIWQGVHNVRSSPMNFCRCHSDILLQYAWDILQMHRDWSQRRLRSSTS